MNHLLSLLIPDHERLEIEKRRVDQLIENETKTAKQCDTSLTHAIEMVVKALERRDEPKRSG